MKIEKVLFEPFTLKFKKPFVFGNNTLTHKHGFHLLLHSEELTGKGEITILPPFGTPTADDITNTFQDVENFLKESDPLYILSGLIEKSKTYPPVLESAIEQAIYSLLCKRSGNVSPANLLNKKYAKKIPVNGVVSTSDPLVAVNTVKKLWETGIRTIKLKVGSDSFPYDIKKISAIRDIFADEISLRLDANGSWSLEQAKKNLPQLEKFDIEYIEQPVLDCNEFNELRLCTSIKLAADEGIRDIQTAISLINERIPDVLIIKPLLLGGFRKSVEIANLAKKAGIETVVTTSLDGAVGRRVAVVTAALIDSPFSHGLSTGSLFEQESEPDYYLPQNGYIYTNALLI